MNGAPVKTYFANCENLWRYRILRTCTFSASAHSTAIDLSVLAASGLE